VCSFSHQPLVHSIISHFRGKSYWITSAVRRCLGEQTRNPFLLYKNGNCFLFVEDGVFQQDVKNISAWDFAPFLRTFIDADECPTGIPERLAGNTNLYIMFTTSPGRQRWKPLTKGSTCAEIVMSPHRRNTLCVSFLGFLTTRLCSPVFGSP